MTDKGRLHATGDRRERPKVNDGAHATNGIRHCGGINDRAFDDLDSRAVMFQIVFKTRAEVVEHANGITFLEKTIDEMGANEPGSAGDKTQIAHRDFPSKVRRMVD